MSPPSQRARSTRRIPAAIVSTDGGRRVEMRRQRGRGVAHLLRLHREDDELGARDRRVASLRRTRRRREARREPSRCSGDGSTTRKSAAARPRASIPPMRAVAMLPPPMKVTLVLHRSSPPLFVAAAPAASGDAADAHASARLEVRRAPEDRAPDAHQRRALGDRGVEIRGHPHRQRVDGKAGRSARVESVTRRLRNCARCRRRSAVGSAMPISPRSRNRGSDATAWRERHRPAGGDDRFSTPRR